MSILNSNKASKQIKDGVRITRARMAKLTAESMIKYYWSSIVGTAKSIDFAKHLKEEKFVRFEEIIDEFRNKFSDEWIKSDKFKNREFDVILMF